MTKNNQRPKKSVIKQLLINNYLKICKNYYFIY